MRLLVTAASVMLAASGVSGECVVVEPESHPSTSDARIVITLGGKPAEHLPLAITVLDNRGDSRLRQVTDRRGTINLKKLSPGPNYITFNTVPGVNPGATAVVRLDVSDRVSASSRITLALTPVPVEPTIDDLVAAKSSLPIELAGPKFMGTVVDVAGAGISGAQIAVYRRAPIAKPYFLKVKADDQGNFVAPLEPGTYTIVVTSSGFQTQFVAVEIKRDAPDQGLSIELKIGSVC